MEISGWRYNSMYSKSQQMGSSLLRDGFRDGRFVMWFPNVIFECESQYSNSKLSDDFPAFPHNVVERIAYNDEQLYYNILSYKSLDFNCALKSGLKMNTEEWYHCSTLLTLAITIYSHWMLVNVKCLLFQVNICLLTC